MPTTLLLAHPDLKTQRQLCFHLNRLEHSICISLAEVSEVIIDSDHKIVTSPAFIYNGKFYEIQDSVSNMVNAVLKLM
jgi:enhancing lycopene biosynthesis protein 2